MMKKTVILVLVTALLGSMLAGCGSSTGNTSAASSDVSLTSDDDILIYDKPDSSKLQLTVGMIGTYFDGEINMLKEFEKQNPDIDLVYYDITGGNEAYHPIDELLNSGDAPDLLISSYVLKDTSKLEDLTDYEGVSNFDMGTLMQNTTDGHVYFLPGPITFSSLSYNKALFKQYGWKLPATLDEFFALCEQITKDTGGEVVPINLNAKYPKEFVNTLFGMLYDELFTGTENQKWLHDYKAGKAFFSGHMEPLYDLCQRFIDAGILNEDSFSYSATKIKEEFKAGKMAMCTLGVNSDEAEQFSLFPYPGEKTGEQTIMRSVNFFASAVKKDYPDQKMAAIKKFVNYFAQPETQKIFIGNAAMVPSTKNAEFPDNASAQEIKAVYESGRTFMRDMLLLDSVPAATFTGVAAIREGMLDMAAGTRTEAEAIKETDAKEAAAIANPTAAESEKVAAASADFTSLETSEMMADMFREKTGSDIALILHGVTYRGNVMRIYSGNITAEKVTYLKPRSFDNDTKLLKVKMTGKQLKDALNDPLGTDGKTADCVYAFSGLKGTYAPWNAVGSKVKEITLADGSAIDDAKTYTVSFWDGTVFDKYYDAASAEAADGSFDELLTAYFKEKGTIAPAKDGRLKLDWN